jgi:HSP20 family protein
MKTLDIYPGMFVPKKGSLPENEIEISNKWSCVKPAINIKETPDLIRIDMLIPGVSRESFQIGLQENMLEIGVMCDQIKLSKDDFQVHEFDVITYRRKIKLPKNADSAFIQAYYKDGVLSIIVPKSNNPIDYCQEQIFVY